MSIFFSTILSLIRSHFNEVVIQFSTDEKSADIFIDCLKDSNFEVTLDLRQDVARIGKVRKDSELGDFSTFELVTHDIKVIEKVFLDIKKTGKFLYSPKLI